VVGVGVFVQSPTQGVVGVVNTQADVVELHQAVEQVPLQLAVLAGSKAKVSTLGLQQAVALVADQFMMDDYFFRPSILRSNILIADTMNDRY